MAYRVAATLKIPISTWDFEKQYRNKVVNYLYREYQAGRTPNPDVICNKEIKFKEFLRLAKAQGADKIATGHYARIKQDKQGWHLLEGVDAAKDQSYFLSALNQSQLSQTLFPLGNLTKMKVRGLARRLKLPNADRPDSQGICFIGEVRLEDFLKRKLKGRPGPIVTTKGQVIGQHHGIYHYTIGQRRGLNIGGGTVYYVIAKDMKKNRLVVGTDKDPKLYAKSVRVKNWHWLGQPLKLPLKAQAKIRYRQTNQACAIKKSSSGQFQAIFNKRQRAVAASQILVAYRGSELIGSGVIK